MTVFGFHASHEQIAPSQLLSDVQHAEAAGFDAAMCSDHFMPWSERQGHSGFAFSWLGAALASTSFSIGSVCTPGQRYHPAVVAQATATLGEMFPGRYWSALGAGQAMNEHVTGDAWLNQDLRRRRLRESAQLIRDLHAGEWVGHHQGMVTATDAYLYDRPADPVPLYAACITPESAALAAEWADGFITLNQPGAAQEQVLQAYREAGGTGPAMLQVHLSWAETQAKAEEIAYDQWRTNVFGPPLDQDLPTAEHFDSAAAEVSMDSVREAVWTSSSAGQHVEWLAQAGQAGFKRVYLHHVGQTQAPFIDTFGDQVLPQLR
ncbi:LLM class F420-dependent oxidoreductase [Saccharomonospora sp. CUA-673]|uniref:TIGR03885 family FMN-dependent LLM class oxidoreductase n=1 Tax=Saccharomonospora sp. CUA-673 TaxID=1904969 RepID=UPI00095BBFD3|nr:TIGR03885 family FMN-dependent LLM class oxidoreductase [Saccharomonospora sp. CUA-673]OLT49281.1 LLM class F420-dependent oxidoreductase [Saccharomonospora sp. CUA-673]